VSDIAVTVFLPRIFVSLRWGDAQWRHVLWQGLRDHFAHCGEIVRADVFTERSGDPPSPWEPSCCLL
jgi:hypothetical protein